jgi:hypothetical protein
MDRWSGIITLAIFGKMRSSVPLTELTRGPRNSYVALNQEAFLTLLVELAGSTSCPFSPEAPLARRRGPLLRCCPSFPTIINILSKGGPFSARVHTGGSIELATHKLLCHPAGLYKDQARCGFSRSQTRGHASRLDAVSPSGVQS